MKVWARLLRKFWSSSAAANTLARPEGYTAESGGGVGWASQEDLRLLCGVVERDADVLFQLAQAAHCQLTLILDLLCSRQALQQVTVSVACHLNSSEL